jgi:glycoprotein-N-acetylgalactosamine 3-beta-galactosyltransferase
VIVNGGFHSGGGGYLISREALKRLGSTLTNDYEFCGNSGFEDIDVGHCLRTLGVYPNSSLDELGRER